MLISICSLFRRRLRIWAGLLVCGFPAISVRANPAGGTVAQGNATFNTAGSKLTIQTSDKAFINWQSFNIGLGETTSFIQPSSSSLVWNQIHDSNPSQILGNLNANGYVVLQNQSGFYIGGQASIATHGLIITTAPIPMPDLSSGGAWEFSAPPPTASIINYGQINVAGGNPAFLIAHDIQNNGTITAPGGNIGLYAGKQVLLCDRPDGRGLSATVTLPEGSVDNSGKLIADAGTIAMHAQVVNQGGLVQANSVREVNGVIELVASDSLNLSALSSISARGDRQGTSSGGSVTLKAGKYNDNAGSIINVSGGAQGGNGGQVEISAVSMNGVQSRVLGSAVSGWRGGSITLDPDYINLVSGSSSSGSGSSSSDPLRLGVDSFAGFTSISLQAAQNIELSTTWNLADAAGPANLSLTAGNNIVLDDGGGISAGQNWSLSLSAGPQNLASKPAAGTGGIYLNGATSFIQSQNGLISLWAANEVKILVGSPGDSSVLNGIRTLGGGNIQVTTQFGDVNTGGNTHGYFYLNTAPFHTASPILGGIGTVAGGDVNISAGGDVRSYLPVSGDGGQDAGTGAFGNQPGNVTINAGGTVYGHYVLTAGVGSITAQKNAGGLNPNDNLALSLTKGAWTVNAPNGNIYLQEVRNPNGVYNETTRRGTVGSNPNHLFDYDPSALVRLNAGNTVDFLTSPSELPRQKIPVPAIFPPSLQVNAGPGGVLLNDQLTLFPSANGEIQISTTGGGNLSGTPAVQFGTVELLMSDSGFKNYGTSVGTGLFTDQEHGSTPLEVNNINPVSLNISGSMNNIRLVTVKETHITVDGDIFDSVFSGQNLHKGDDTFIKVGGKIYNSPAYSTVLIPAAPTLVDVQDLPPSVISQFDTLLKLAVDPVKVAQIVVPAGIQRSQLGNYVSASYLLGFSGNFNASTPFAYDAATGKLSFLGQMNSQFINLFSHPTVTVLRYASDGFPVVDASGHFVTDTYTWADPGAINQLIAATVNNAIEPNYGFRIGGPGFFDVHAGSIQLGNSFGILSVGAHDIANGGLLRYQNLASITPVGADLKVTADGDIQMLTSTIASLAGGNVTMASTGGEIDLGSAEALFSNRALPLGAFVTGAGGNISVSAYKDVNIEGSRIAAYDGGSVTVHSDTGNVDAGSGGATAAQVETHFVDPVTKVAKAYTAGVYGSGILAVTLVDPTKVPGAPTKPGDIEVTTPQGDIRASLGGILQEALNGNISSGPQITLNAGSTGHPGNIDLGDSGVIGGTVNLTANGDISGLIISRQNSTVSAAQNFTGTVLSGGSANVSATAGTVSGTIVGVGGATVSGGAGVSAQVLSQNVSVNGTANTSTLGTAATGTSVGTAASGNANKDAKETLTNTDTAQNDDDSKKKKMPILARLVGRVTVILPK